MKDTSNTACKLVELIVNTNMLAYMAEEIYHHMSKNSLWAPVSYQLKTCS